MEPVVQPQTQATSRGLSRNRRYCRPKNTKPNDAEKRRRKEMSTTMLASGARAVPSMVSSIQEIPLEKIRESTSNPRRAFDEAQLRGSQPASLRSCRPKGKAENASGHHLWKQATSGGYQVHSCADVRRELSAPLSCYVVKHRTASKGILFSVYLASSLPDSIRTPETRKI